MVSTCDPTPLYYMQLNIIKLSKNIKMNVVRHFICLKTKMAEFKVDLSIFSYCSTLSRALCAVALSVQE